MPKKPPPIGRHDPAFDWIMIAIIAIIALAALTAALALGLGLARAEPGDAGLAMACEDPPGYAPQGQPQ